MIGITNAPVFPLPVLPLAIRSRPSIIRGMALVCISVGSFQANLTAAASRRRSSRPIPRKDASSSSPDFFMLDSITYKLKAFVITHLNKCCFNMLIILLVMSKIRVEYSFALEFIHTYLKLELFNLVDGKSDLCTQILN